LIFVCFLLVFHFNSFFFITFAAEKAQLSNYVMMKKYLTKVFAITNE